VAEVRTRRVAGQGVLLWAQIAVAVGDDAALDELKKAPLAELNRRLVQPPM
jgi:hypothetical protein